MLGVRMKITGNQRVQRPTTAKAKSAPRAGAGSRAPADTLNIAGVPQAELTPKVRQALASLMQEVAELRAELAETQQRIRELSDLAFTDPLTGVYNRRAFVAELNRTLAIVDRHGQPASLAFFDLDDMKMINDRYGHRGGDAALAHVAHIIQDNIRQTDAVGRLGGDEFGVIFSYSSKDAAKAKVEGLRQQIISAPLTLDNEMISVRITAGVAEIEKGATVESTLDIADAAMYEGKKSKADGSRS